MEKNEHYINDPPVTLEELENFKNAWMLKHENTWIPEGIKPSMPAAQPTPSQPTQSSSWGSLGSMATTVADAVSEKVRQAKAFIDPGTTSTASTINDSDLASYFQTTSTSAAVPNVGPSDLQEKILNNNAATTSSYLQSKHLLDTAYARDLLEQVHLRWKVYLKIQQLNLEGKKDEARYEWTKIKETETEPSINTAQDGLNFYNQKYELASSSLESMLNSQANSAEITTMPDYVIKPVNVVANIRDAPSQESDIMSNVADGNVEMPQEMDTVEESYNLVNTEQLRAIMKENNNYISGSNTEQILATVAPDVALHEETNVNAMETSSEEVAITTPAPPTTQELFKNAINMVSLSSAAILKDKSLRRIVDKNTIAQLERTKQATEKVKESIANEKQTPEIIALKNAVEKIEKEMERVGNPFTRFLDSMPILDSMPMSTAATTTIPTPPVEQPSSDDASVTVAEDDEAEDERLVTKLDDDEKDSANIPLLSWTSTDKILSGDYSSDRIKGKPSGTSSAMIGSMIDLKHFLERGSLLRETDYFDKKGSTNIPILPLVPTLNKIVSEDDSKDRVVDEPSKGRASYTTLGSMLGLSYFLSKAMPTQHMNQRELSHYVNDDLSHYLNVVFGGLGGLGPATGPPLSRYNIAPIIAGASIGAIMDLYNYMISNNIMGGPEKSNMSLENSIGMLRDFINKLGVVDTVINNIPMRWGPPEKTNLGKPIVDFITKLGETDFYKQSSKVPGKLANIAYKVAQDAEIIKNGLSLISAMYDEYNIMYDRFLPGIKHSSITIKNSALNKISEAQERLVSLYTNLPPLDSASLYEWYEKIINEMGYIKEDDGEPVVISLESLRGELDRGQQSAESIAQVLKDLHMELPHEFLETNDKINDILLGAFKESKFLPEIGTEDTSLIDGAEGTFPSIEPGLTIYTGSTNTETGLDANVEMSKNTAKILVGLITKQNDMIEEMEDALDYKAAHTEDPVEIGLIAKAKRALYDFRNVIANLMLIMTQFYFSPSPVTGLRVYRTDKGSGMGTPYQNNKMARDVNNHDDNKKMLDRKAAGHFRKLHTQSHLPITHGDIIDHHLRNQPEHEKNAFSKNNVKGCGFCGSTKDIMVNGRTPTDYTCKNCLDKKGMSITRVTSRQSKFQPIEQSSNEQHKKDSAQLKTNNYLDSLKSIPLESNIEKFEKGAGLDKRFVHRMKNDYIMNRKPIHHLDEKRLAYGLGVYTHNPEQMTPAFTANMHTMMTNHLKYHNDPKAKTPMLTKFETYEGILDELRKRPGVVKRITL